MQLPTHMFIARNTEFGPPSVVKIERVPVPTPQKGQLLVKIHATTVSAGDWRLRSRTVPRGFGWIMGFIFGFSRPKYQCLGTDLSGEVVAVGEGSTRFKVGDRIVANLGMKLGGHAQYAVLNAQGPIALIPEGVSYQDAAATIFGGTTALVFLRDKIKLQKGERLLVIGAAGSVGNAAVQLGRLMGANVTGVCSTEKTGHVLRTGAHQVIDYRTSDWRQSPEKYDVILDTVGGTTFENTRHKLTPLGRLGLVVADLPLTLSSAWNSLIHKQKTYAGSIAENASDLEYLLSLCENGSIKPLIGAVYPLNRIVDAHKEVESGHKLGNTVVLTEEA